MLVSFCLENKLIWASKNCRWRWENCWGRENVNIPLRFQNDWQCRIYKNHRKSRRNGLLELLLEPWVQNDEYLWIWTLLVHDLVWRFLLCRFGGTARMIMSYFFITCTTTLLQKAPSAWTLTGIQNCDSQYDEKTKPASSIMQIWKH